MAEENAILEAVDRLLAIHEEWAANPDPQLKAIPPRELEDAAEDMFETTTFADIPAQLRDLVTSIEGFQTQWGMYAAGAREKDGGPKNSLWRALRGVIASRNISGELRVKRPESVAELLRQKVTPQQIALEIYGHNGRGPFVKNGEIQFKLITQEAEKPGSVISPDWVPPYEEERLKRYHIQARRRLGQVDDLIEKTTPKPQDPISLLRQGQYLDVVMDVCNLTEKQVRGIAEAIEVQVQIRQPVTTERGPFEREVSEADAAMMDSMARNPVQSPVTDGPIRVTKDTRAEVEKLFNEGLGAPEIAKKIGKGLTPKHVAEIIRRSRQAKAEPTV